MVNLYFPSPLLIVFCCVTDKASALAVGSSRLTGGIIPAEHVGVGRTVRPVAGNAGYYVCTGCYDTRIFHAVINFLLGDRSQCIVLGIVGVFTGIGNQNIGRMAPAFRDKWSTSDHEEHPDFEENP